MVNGETVLLVPAQDSPALAQAISSLLADPERRKKMGGVAQARVVAQYSRETMAAGMVALYKRLLAAA